VKQRGPRVERGHAKPKGKGGYPKGGPRKSD
jgi:hypothetical protein